MIGIAVALNSCSSRAMVARCLGAGVMSTAQQPSQEAWRCWRRLTLTQVKDIIPVGAVIRFARLRSALATPEK
jgi:hypothetical protein